MRQAQYAKNADQIIHCGSSLPDLAPTAAGIRAAVAPSAPLCPAPADGDGGDGAWGRVVGHHAKLLEQQITISGKLIGYLRSFILQERFKIIALGSHCK